MASNILKVLLIIFAIGVIILGTFILPLMADQQVDYFPELEYAKGSILLGSQALLLLLLFGIGIIMYLIIVFDRGAVFTLKFIRGLEILFVMCIVASLGIIILFKYMTSFGGPGPALALVMLGTIIFIWILGSVIMLIRAIIKNAITYKTDYDLTV